jgi:hypothetical protein
MLRQTHNSELSVFYNQFNIIIESLREDRLPDNPESKFPYLSMTTRVQSPRINGRGEFEQIYNASVNQDKKIGTSMKYVGPPFKFPYGMEVSVTDKINGNYVVRDGHGRTIMVEPRFLKDLPIKYPEDKIEPHKDIFLGRGLYTPGPGQKGG